MAEQAELVPVEDQGEVAVQSQSAAIMSLIERAARDQTVDIDKMERLFEMHERMKARQAIEDYHTAFAEMQKELPEITKQGETRDKEQNLMYRYAKWEDINRDIKPILTKYGFGLSFRIEQNEAGLSVTAILSRGGHTEQTSLLQSLDMGGAKMNANQTRGAAVSYGKRYTSSALLNLVSYDENDTDGNTHLSGDTLTGHQVKAIRDKLETLGRGEDMFLQWAGQNGLGATELEAIAIENFDRLIGQLDHWLKVSEASNG